MRLQRLAVVLLCASLASCGFRGDAGVQRQRAEEALARGDYGEAVVMLRTLIEKDAGDADIALLLARALFQQGDVAGSARLLQRARDGGADPQVVAVVQSQWQLAAEDFQAVLDAASDPGVAFDDAQRSYFRGRALQGLGRAPEALAVFGELAAQQPGTAELHLRMAQCHAYLGRDALAQAALDNALSLPVPEGAMPVSAEAWIEKAAIAGRSEDAHGMLEAYGNAVDAAPGQLPATQFARLLAGAAQQALLLGDLARAEQYRARLARVLPQASVTRVVGAQVQMHGSQLPRAVADLQRLQRDQPGDRQVAVLLAAAQLSAGSLEQALSGVKGLASAGEFARPQLLIEEASRRSAGSLERAMAVAGALVALNQPALARLELQRAEPGHADAVALQVAITRLDLHNGRHTEGLQRARILASREPSNDALQLLVADALSLNGDHKAAAAAYERAWMSRPSGPVALALMHARRRASLPDPDAPVRDWLRQQPRDASLRVSLATALHQAGAHAAATTEFERALGDAASGDPLRTVALNNLAVLYARRDDPKALDTARQAYEGAGHVAAVQDTYGWVLLQQGRTDDAMPLLKSAMEQAPAAAEIRYHNAVALVRSGDREPARLLLDDLMYEDEASEFAQDARRLRATLQQ